MAETEQLVGRFGFGFTICHLAACIAILLVICFSFGFVFVC